MKKKMLRGFISVRAQKVVVRKGRGGTPKKQPLTTTMWLKNVCMCVCVFAFRSFTATMQYAQYAVCW